MASIEHAHPYTDEDTMRVDVDKLLRHGYRQIARGKLVDSTFHISTGHSNAPFSEETIYTLSWRRSKVAPFFCLKHDCKPDAPVRAS